MGVQEIAGIVPVYKLLIYMDILFFLKFLSLL